MDLNFRTLQEAQAQWAERNFGPNIPTWRRIMLLMEEVGELAHADTKRRDSIRGSTEELTAKLLDAIGDCTVVLSAICTSEGVDYQDIVERVWGEVSQRDWVRERMAHGQ